MACYLAVDAGGTKTEFLLAEEDRELGRALTGTIKRVNADPETAARNLRDALADLERGTGVSMKSVTGTCVGTSGNTVPLVTDWLREGFAKHVSGPLLLVGDVDQLPSVGAGEVLWAIAVVTARITTPVAFRNII